MSLKSLVASVALAVGLCTSAACSGGQDDSAKPPLSWVNENAVWCLPSARYPEVALGKQLDFEDGAPIMIESVRMVDAQGMKLVDAYVVPLGRDQSRLGAGAFPPLETFPETWRRADKAAGAVIPPGKARELVAHISYVGPGTATMSTLEITYQQTDTEYVVQTFEALRLEAGSC